MQRTPSESVPVDSSSSRTVSSVEMPKPAPRPAPKRDHYSFVFDRWLPIAPRPEDEFILA